MKDQLHRFVRGRPDTFYSDDLTPEFYASLMMHATTVIGNSTSGRVEAPSFKIPVVDIGDRQKHRERAKNVLCVKPDRASIVKGVKRAMGDAFRKTARTAKNPYDAGGASNEAEARGDAATGGYRSETPNAVAEPS